MKKEKIDETLLENEELENLDEIYTFIPQYSWYPIRIVAITAVIMWTTGGMLIFWANILAAIPGMKQYQAYGLPAIVY